MRWATHAMLAAMAFWSGTMAMAESWTRSWEAAPLSMPTSRPGQPVPATLTDVTFQMPVRLSSGGHQLRLRLSNELSDAALTIGAASIALADANGRPIEGSTRLVRFAGKAGVTLAPATPLVSDAVAIDVPPAARLIVRIHVPGEAQHATVHSLHAATTLILAGDRTRGATATDAVGSSVLRYIVSGVDVLGPAPATIVTIGDSITDGADTPDDPWRGWPDVLADRLRAAGRPFAVANAGISGNRLLVGGSGPTALARLDRDVLSVPGVRYLIVLEGVNDIGGATRDKAPMPAPDAIIAAYRQLIDRAHDRGIKVIGGTILPYKGAFYYSVDGDRVRRAVNAWIRTPGHFDGVIDFDRALADPSDPLTMAAAYDSGDRLHPAPAGYRAMGAAIDLQLFR